LALPRNTKSANESGVSSLQLGYNFIDVAWNSAANAGEVLVPKVPITGAVYGLASAVLFGVSTPFAKLLLGTVDPWLLAGLLYVGSGVGLSAFRVIGSVSAKYRNEARLSRADAPWIAAAIFAGGVAGPALLMIGLVSTSASSGSLLLNLEGLATTPGSRPSARIIIGMA
jgi:drug/metabolite transporter (DMT)-like permease